MEMDLSSMWLQEPELEDQAGLMNQYIIYDDDDKMKPYMNMVDHKSSSTSTADFSLSPPEITEDCFTDEWLSTTDPTSCCFQQQIDQIKLQPPPPSTNFQKSSAARSHTPNTLSATSSKTTTTTTSFTISFGDLNNPMNPSFDDDSRLGGHQETGKFQASRNPIQTQADHVLAERKRREKLSRHFISLSALLPNLKKMDKATVLEDAANYIKELEERLKELEGGVVVNRKQDSAKCVIALKKRFISEDEAGDAGSSSNNNNNNNNNNSAAAAAEEDSTSAEIEVRMSGSCVLIRILLSHQKTTSSSSSSNNLVCKVLDKMQNQLGLSIISSTVMPFVNTTTLIAVVAQIEGDLQFMTATDVVNNLQLAL